MRTPRDSSPRAVEEWLDANSAWYRDVQLNENKQAIAELVLRIWRVYGILPHPPSSANESPEEPNLAYEPNFVSIEIRKTKPGFRLLLKEPKKFYEDLGLPARLFAAEQGPTPRLEIAGKDDIEWAWKAVQAAARKDRIPVVQEQSESRITIDSGVCGGRPCIRGLRMRVSDVLGMLASAMDADDILREYPYLEREDIAACLQFAARWLNHPVLRAS